MQFPTVAFAIFFLAAFVANWLLRPHPLVWRATMIAVSLYFCAWVDVRFALVVLGVAALNWVAAAAAHRAMRGRSHRPACGSSERRWPPTSPCSPASPTAGSSSSR